MSTEAQETETRESGPVASPLDRRVPLTVERFYQFLESGVFHEDDPFSLWKGCLVTTMTKHQPHTIALTMLLHSLIRCVPDGWYVASESPVAIGNDSLPEPDVTIIRGHPHDFPRRPPSARNVALLIEVADSSLAEDQGGVLQEYARHGIPQYWIVNIPGRRIEVYTEPIVSVDPPLYRSIRHYTPGEIVPVILDGREVGQVAVNDVLP